MTIYSIFEPRRWPMSGVLRPVRQDGERVKSRSGNGWKFLIHLALP